LKDNSRTIIFKILKDFKKTNKSYTTISNYYLSNVISKKERGFILNITKGIFRNIYLLDENIKYYSKNKKIDKSTQLLLYIGIYQIIFCNSIPDYAAVNSTIDLASIYSKRSKSFINAILRKVSDKPISFNDNVKIFKKLNCPNIIYKKLSKSYGAENINNYLTQSLQKPKLSIRINNSNKIKYLQLLKENDISYKIDTYLSNFITIDQFDSKNIILSNIKSGDMYIQNPSSAFVVHYLNPKKGDNILDACTAPGGKASYITILTNNKANITCIDKDKTRLTLTKDNMMKMSLKNITYICDDSRTVILKESYNKILIDLPCSSSGTFQKNPDIKWKINKKQLASLKITQYEILQNISNFLQVNGELVYSTCSLFSEENEDIIIKFLNNNRNFNIVKPENNIPSEFKNDFGGITIFPNKNNYEGMFAVKLIKNA